MARLGVRKDTGKLFFDFHWAGKRRREQTTLDDTPQNRKKAEQVLRALSVAIERGVFDYAKYFPSRRVPTGVVEQQAAQAAILVTCARQETIDQFIAGFADTDASEAAQACPADYMNILTDEEPGSLLRGEQAAQQSLTAAAQAGATGE